MLHSVEGLARPALAALGAGWGLGEVSSARGPFRRFSFVQFVEFVYYFFGGREVWSTLGGTPALSSVFFLGGGEG